MSSLRSTAPTPDIDTQAEADGDHLSAAGQERRVRPLHRHPELNAGLTRLAPPRASAPGGDAPLDADTRRLATDIARAFGLPAQRLHIRIDDYAAGETERRGARGLVKNAGVLLHPKYFDPRSADGRYLLGHELAHLAQLRRFRQRPGEPVAAGLHSHESEAHQLGLIIAEGRVPYVPVYELPDNTVAADQALDTVVADRYEQELERIRSLLRGFLGFLWVTDGDINQVLTILQSVAFVIARSMVTALDQRERNHRYKRTLIDEISSGHFDRFRREILAAYSAMPAAILREADEGIFDGMDFRGLSDEEHFAVRYVRDNGFPAAAWQALTDPQQQGEARAAAVRQLIDDEAEDALGPGNFNLAEQQAAAQAQLQAETQQREEAVARARGEIGEVIAEIQSTLEQGADETQRMQIIDTLSRYLEDPQLFRGIVEALQPPTASADLLDDLLRNFPVRAIYRPSIPDTSREPRAGARVPGPHTRLATLLHMASLRPPWRNVQLAEDLLSQAWIFNRIEEHEAYLAFQLIKALPERIRANFLEAGGGEFADRMREHMTREMQELATVNFYTGGEGRLDLASIQAQLLDDTLWHIDSRGRLKGLMRMAIAAGEHHWLFDQSRLHYGSEGSQQRRDYTHQGFLRHIVEPFQLYNPAATDAEGNSAPRRRWRPEYLRAVERGGVMDFIFQSREPWSVIGNALFGQSLGGQGLNAVALQDVLGGSFLGIRFAGPEEIQDEQLAADARRAMEERRGINFIDSAYWDTDRGVLEVRADDLVIAAIRYPIGSLLVQSGAGRLQGLELNLVYPSREHSEQAPAMNLRIRQLDLEDMLLIFHDSMMGIDSVQLRGLHVQLGRDAIENRRGSAGRGLDARTLFPLTPLLRIIGLGTGGPGRRGAEISAALTNPPVASPLLMSVDSLTLGGLTTSSGHYVEAVEMGDVQVGISGTRQDYLDMLWQSHMQLGRRRSRLRRTIELTSSETRRSEMEDMLARLDNQRAAVLQLIRRIVAAQREVRQLRQLESPSPAQREQLGRQEEFLRSFDRGGMVLDAGSIRLRGLAGREQAEAVNLNNVHGHGTSTAGLMAFLTNSEAINRIVQGDDYRAPVVRSLQRDEGSFVIDLGDLSLPDDFTVRSAIPGIEAASRDYERAAARLQRRPHDQQLRDEVQRLLTRRDNVARYHALAAIGITYLNSAEQRQLRSLYESLSGEEAFYAHRLSAEGARLEFGRSGRRIGLHAERLEALRPVDENGDPIAGGAALRVAGVAIGEARGDNVTVSVEVEGGLLNPSAGGLIDSGDIRERLSRISVEGDNLQALDIGLVDGESRFDGGTLREFGLQIDTRGGVIDAHARDATMLTRALVQREITRLQGIAEESRSTQQSEQLQALLAAQQTLQGYETEIAQLQQQIRATTDPEQRAPLQESLNALLLTFQTWRRQLPITAAGAADLSVRISGLGNLASPDFNLQDALQRGVVIEGTGPRTAPTVEPDGERRSGRLFSSAAATQLDIAGIRGRRVEAGAGFGRIEYSSSRIGFHDVYLESLALDGVSARSGDHQIWSHGNTVLSGILASGEVLFQPQPDDPDQRQLQSIRLQRLGIVNLAARELGYANSALNVEAEIENGSIGEIAMDGLSVDMHPGTEQSPTVLGDIRLGNFTNAQINARIGETLRRLRGRLNGDSVTIGFLQSGERRIDIEDLNVDDGLVRTDAGTIRFSARRLRGEIVQSADGNVFHFNDVRLQRLNFGRFSYRAGEQTLSGEGPTVFHGVRVDARLDKSDPRNLQVQLNRIHADRITSEHLVYERAGYTLTFRRPAPTPAAGGGAGEEAAEAAATPRSSAAERPAVEIINFDIRNLRWSSGDGLEAGSGGGRSAIDMDTLHAALNIHRDTFTDINAVVDAGDIDVEFLAGGEQVVDIDTLGLEASGQLSPGVQVDVSAQAIDPGVITVAEDSIEVPNLTLPLVEINSLDLDASAYRLQVHERGEPTRLQNMQANVRLEIDREAEQPIQRIVVRSLHIPTLLANNATLTVKNFQSADEAAGRPARDLVLSIDEEAVATVSDIRLGGRGEAADGFIITPTASGWSTDGLITFGRADIQTLGFEIENYLSGSTNVLVTAREAEQPAFSMGLFSDGRYEFNLQQIDLADLEARRGDHHIRFSTEAAADGETVGISLRNLRRTPSGDYSLDELGARGIVYENGPLGLKVSIQQATLPSGFNFSHGGLLRVPNLAIQEAKFEINNLQSMLQELNSRPPSGLTLNVLPVLDSLQGEVNLQIISDGNESPAEIAINDGRISLTEVEESLSYPFQLTIGIAAEGDTLTFTIDKPGPSSVTTFTYEDLAADEQPTGDNLETPLRTFLHNEPVVNSTSTEESAPPRLENIDADLTISPAPLIEVDGGQLRLGSEDDDNAMAINVTGQVGGEDPGELQIRIPQASVSAVEGHPITINGVTLRDGNLTVTELGADITFDGFSPRRVKGTIRGATLSDAQIQFNDEESTE